GTINNPNLKPEKLFDYEVGFKQTLTKSSAITISGFYKERKDMIQIRPYLYAWPTTYYTYGNRDFSTTKGMMLKYDLRRTKNLRMDVAYTLQFANGTGSGTTSSVASTGNPSAPGLLSGFISAGLPNIRTVFPLNIDVRHNIVTNIDYRYGKDQGPVIANTHFLQNAGVNFIFRTRSGEPYTKYTQPRNVANTVDGQVNGSRLPWHYMLDMRLDKDFKLQFGKKNQEVTKASRGVYVNAYVLITNILNRRDIISVDGYTGRTDDDGYLTHPQGIQTTNLQYNQQSYVDLYSSNLLGAASTRLNLPRRINLGLNLNF
ncbi:MAG: TonB-dependent receptor, partial [Chitinophagaceae bacterium]|nr:TonB-dependent receptor [Chitinophagaceae bacterium]